MMEAPTLYREKRPRSNRLRKGSDLLQNLLPCLKSLLLTAVELEAERKIRPLTIGRKNTLFLGSEESVKVAATYYTLIETAKLNDLSPVDYLTHVFRQLMEGNKDYERLLPGN